MDRNTVIGFSLIFLILMGYYWYTAPSPEQQAQMAKTQDSLAKIDALNSKAATAKFQSNVKPDSAKIDSVVLDKSDFASFAAGESKLVTIANKHLSSFYQYQRCFCC